MTCSLVENRGQEDELQALLVVEPLARFGVDQTFLERFAAQRRGPCHARRRGFR